MLSWISNFGRERAGIELGRDESKIRLYKFRAGSNKRDAPFEYGIAVCGQENASYQ